MMDTFDTKIFSKTSEEIIERNRKILYHLSVRYAYLEQCLTESLRDTLLAIYKFIRPKSLIWYQGYYIFFVYNKKLTYGVRKSSGEATSSRHINFLCALGIFEKIPQRPYRDETLFINRNHLRNSAVNSLFNDDEKHRPMNFFRLIEFTDSNLAKIERRAELLYHASITAGNISYNRLVANGLPEIGNEVFYANDKTAPDRKLSELIILIEVMHELIEEQGYTTRQQVIAEYRDKSEVKKVFSLFKAQIESNFDYKRPTAQDKTEFNLTSNKYIYKERLER